MEMNRGSLNPLFACHPGTVRIGYIPPRSPLSPLGSAPPPSSPPPPPYGLFPLRSRPHRFARFISLFSPLFSFILSVYPFLLCQRLSSGFPRLAWIKSMRAAVAAVCPPNYTEFISYGTGHTRAILSPGYFHSCCNLRTKTRCIYCTDRILFIRLRGNIIFSYIHLRLFERRFSI